jgi:hypothetical protein
MARGRRGRGRNTQSGISFNVPSNIRRAVAAAKKEVRTVVIVGKVRAGNLEIQPAQLARVTKRGKTKARREIIFLAVNAPFKTKALTAAL